MHMHHLAMQQRLFMRWDSQSLPQIQEVQPMLLCPLWKYQFHAGNSVL